VKPSGYDKGTAIDEYLRSAALLGRTPVFLGDDLTDEVGFDLVNRHGGHSIKIGRGRTRAQLAPRRCARRPRSFLAALAEIPSPLRPRGGDIQNLDLALIGNLDHRRAHRRDATIVWGCFPRFDGDALFC
jgi:hypothetical protein